MLSYLIIYWNVIYLICCVLLNFASLIVHLGTWRSRYRGRSPNRDRYRNRDQTSGTEVSAPAAVTVFYLISVNLLYLSLCKLPLLHSQWFMNFRFSEIICFVIVVLTASFECVQTVAIAILCIVLWHRQKTKNYHRRKQDEQDDQDDRKEYRLANGLGQGCLVIFLTSIYCLVVGICASHRFLSFNATSPLKDVSRTDVNATEQFSSVKVSVCKAQVPHYDNPSSSHLWEMSFRWIIGFGCPLLFMAIPSMLHLNFRLLGRQKKIIEEKENRETLLVKCYVTFCLAILWIDFLLRLPSLIHDISLWTSDNSHSDDVNSKAPSVDYKFVLFILTVIFPELRLVYFPLGTLVLLPGGRQKESRKNLTRNFGAKNEIGSEKEIESFVVSTSTVAIETLPSRVRIPETQKLKVNCFKSGKRRRNSFESSSSSVIQKD